MPDRDTGHASHAVLSAWSSVPLLSPHCQPRQSQSHTHTHITCCAFFTEAVQLLTCLFSTHAAAYPFHSSCCAWVTGPGKKGEKKKITAINNVPTKRSTIQVRKTDKGREGRKHDGRHQCVREVLAINRFIYASSVQQPNTGLLGSDSEYSAIKSSSGTRLTQTHVQWLCQSHADVQSIPEACHMHTVTFVNLVRGRGERHWVTSNHSSLQLIRNYCRFLNSCPRITSLISYRNKILQKLFLCAATYKQNLQLLYISDFDFHEAVSVFLFYIVHSHHEN